VKYLGLDPSGFAQEPLGHLKTESTNGEADEWQVDSRKANPSPEQ
jgi:hypothetical protein